MSAKDVILPTEKISEMAKPNNFCQIISEILSIPKYENETDVREDFLVPLLKALGYSNSGKDKIERNVFLSVPDLIIGRKKKNLEKYSPDYILSVDGKRKWLIDAKNPKDSVRNTDYISQAFSYSIHREINVPYFCLCNGEEFAVYQTSEQDYKPITVFKRYELDYRWDEFQQMLSANAFKTRLKLLKGEKKRENSKPLKHVKWEKPIAEAINPRKQGSCIHNGTHPYFTKRAWNVVRKYIDHFTNKDEKVLDPYGGSGVTAIEAFLTERVGIHVDVNPIANFMTSALAIPVKLEKLSMQFEKIEKSFEKYVRQIDKQKNPTPKYWYPRDVKLPKDADVEYLHQYFTKHQLASMSFLRNEIKNIDDTNIKKVFLLIFSSTLVKCNISFHNTPRKGKTPGGGDAGFLKYYRYQIPRKLYSEQDPVEVFKSKY